MSQSIKKVMASSSYALGVEHGKILAAWIMSYRMNEVFYSLFLSKEKLIIACNKLLRAEIEKEIWEIAKAKKKNGNFYHTKRDLNKMFKRTWAEADRIAAEEIL